MVNHDQFWSRIIYILSAVVILAVAFLILGPRPADMTGAIDVSALPRVNAALNGITTLLLISGFVLIKAVGLPGTIVTAGIINILIAAIVWLLSHNDSYNPNDHTIVKTKKEIQKKLKIS